MAAARLLKRHEQRLASARYATCERVAKTRVTLKSAVFEAVNGPFARGCHLRRRVDASTDEAQEYDLLEHPGAPCPDAHDERNGHACQHEDQQHSRYADYSDHPADGTPTGAAWESSVCSLIGG